VRAAPLLAAILAATVIAGSSAPAIAAGGLPAAVSAPAACGQASEAARPVIRHVIVIVMENHSLSSIQGHAPFLNALGKRCGIATNYHAITHPSLPNYLAMTSGSIHHIHSDCGPRDCAQPGPNIFSQLTRHGKRWRAYAESMRVACDTTTAGLYAARHVPAVYYLRVRPHCRQRVRSLGRVGTGRMHRALHSGHAPAFMFVTPNLCNDMHDCPVASGDKWLHKWIPMMVASRTYRHGHTAILIVFDEGGGGSNVVPLIVVSRYTAPHTVSHRPLSHYSLLRTSEKLLGIRRYLGKARSARGLPKAFHL
jgi:phosphatidylinositol-3-phosphatase